MEISEARKIMGTNFVGPDELKHLDGKLKIALPEEIPALEFEENLLSQVKDSHVLALCTSFFLDGTAVTIRNIRDRITLSGCPCFYNQDWYLNEKFIDKKLQTKWVLVSKELMEESRGEQPAEIAEKYQLYSAVELTYLFFVYFFYSDGEMLWKNDYVWCNDTDDKGDQIYVGRYVDASGLNKDGFEVHRHLRIKKNYGVV